MDYGAFPVLGYNYTLPTTQFPIQLAYALKWLVGVACCVSIIGSILIIFTYFAFPELRNTLRQLLVNLSIADLLSAGANLLGLIIDFYHYLDPDIVPLSDQSNVIKRVCEVQGGVTVIGTLAAITWTLSIAVYMFMFIVLKKISLANKLLPVYYIISWGYPIALSIGFGAVGWLGFQAYTTPGYCDIRTTIYNGNNSYDNTTTLVPVIIRYFVTVDLSLILLPPIFIIIRCYIRSMVSYCLNLLQ